MIDWKIYSTHYREIASENGLRKNQIDKLLAYAKKLNDLDLPIIYDLKHFSLLVGYSDEYILKASNNSIPFYRNFRIKKKSGRYRNISEPLPNLKDIQKWILNNILYKIPVSKFAKAFIPNITLKDNAKFHRSQNILLTIDIENFFDSIRFIEVYKLFKHNGYSKGVSVLLSKLCTLEDRLPQGAPTSPYLSNMVFNSLDNRISQFCINREIRYTRYADDLSFSGDFKPGMIIKFVKYVIKSKKLKLNKNKTRTMFNHQRQEVTGIVVNKRMQVARNVRRKLRQDVFYIQKYGLNDHIRRKDIKESNYIKHLLGLSNFIKFVNPKDEKAVYNFDFLKQLLLRN
ncbi:MAG: retron St85 family RNA-directed DNA polymerase [Candidatus Kapaibacterium sp.]